MRYDKPVELETEMRFVFDIGVVVKTTKFCVNARGPAPEPALGSAPEPAIG